MVLSPKIWLIIASMLLAACTPALQVTSSDNFTPQAATSAEIEPATSSVQAVQRRERPLVA